MSSVLYRIANYTVSHARAVLAAWIGMLVITVVAMFTVGGQLTNDFTIPGTEGQEGLDVLEERFEELSGTSGQIVFGVDEGKNIYDYQQTIEETMSKVGEIESVLTSSNPFDDSLMDPLVSDNQRYALGQVQFEFGLDSIDQKVVDEVVKTASEASEAGLDVHVGGNIMSTTEVPLSATEAAGVALALVVLALTFGSFIAASVPIISAITGVAIAMVIVMLIAAVVPISTTTPTLAIMLGLAVGIDYALFIVSRHRDQLRHGYTVAESIPRAIATSGGAVLFAGTTVVIALLALIVANIPFLSVMGMCAALAVAIAALIAVTGLPALLAVLGDRLRPKPKKSRRKKQTDAPEEEAEILSADLQEQPEKAPRRRTPAAWWVSVTTSHPWLTILAVTALVAVMTVPSYALRLALPDNGVEDESTMGRQTYDLVEENFGAGANGPLLVITDIITSEDPLKLMDDLADDISKIKDVDHIQLSTPNRKADLGIVAIIPREGPEAASTENLVHALRNAAPEWEQTYGISNTMVTGSAAVAIDVSEQLFKALLPFGIIVVGLSLVLLTIVFRSLWVPIKATVGYLFSVGAAFGTTTLVFIKGWANDALLIGQVGPVISFMPIILMGVLFGLAMDYEVFLVSRIREDYVHSGKARESIHTGFNASATVVVVAALIMISVFSGFIPGGSFYVQPIAFGLAVGVAVDAFLVRMTLVPAVLQILGDRAWYIPPWLDRMLPTFDVEGMGMDERFRHLDWQKQYGEVVARAHEVTIGGRATKIVDNATVAVRPGQILRLDGARGATRALLLAFGGRARLDEGTLFVFDTSTADESGRVVARTPLLEQRADLPYTPLGGRKKRQNKQKLYLIDRPINRKEAELIERELRNGSAAILTPACRWQFDAPEDEYFVPSALPQEATAR
ncbi:MAG: MMPL family transporter [Actinomycetaceae bacterium]|nr:MMPL family transporter [Actinomycetaceae bacterium]